MSKRLFLLYFYDKAPFLSNGALHFITMNPEYTMILVFLSLLQLPLQRCCSVPDYSG